MKQRFGVAQAIVHDPPVLMFDEPTAGIDPQGAEDFRVLMRQLRDKGKTIFLTSHVMPEVEAICNRIGIIVGGQMNICGNVDELVDHYAQRQGYRLKLCTRHGDEITLFRLLKSIEGVYAVRERTMGITSSTPAGRVRERVPGGQPLAGHRHRARVVPAVAGRDLPRGHPAREQRMIILYVGMTS